MSLSPTRALAVDEWDTWHDDWQAHLAARLPQGGKSTRALYARQLGYVVDWMREQRGITDPEAVKRRDLEAYLGQRASSISARTGKPISGATVAGEFRCLRVFFGWLAMQLVDNPDDAAALRSLNPMAHVAEPKHVPKRTELLTDEQLRALVDACKGRAFNDVRDAAIIRILLDCGLRRSELMGLTLDDVDLDAQQLVVMGKGGKARAVHYGMKASEALRTYLRYRRRHRDARLPQLWLVGKPHRGALEGSGLAQMLRRRAAKAGVPNVHPHKLRHGAYDAFMDAGGDSTAAMALMGWSTRAMLDHYAASGAERRALRQHKRLSPGDRI